MAVSLKQDYLQTHWSEVLSSKLKLNLVNLSASGCTTRMIAFQILESLNYDNALTICMPANNYTRFDLLIDKNSSSKKIIGLQNFSNRSSQTVKFRNHPEAFIKSLNLIEVNDPDEEKFFATKVPWDLFRHIDNWALFYSLFQLKIRNKRFLLLTGNYHATNRPYDIKEYIDIFGNESIVDEDLLSFTKYGFDKIKNPGLAALDPGYHTFPSDQLKIAGILENVILSRKILNG